MGLYLCVGCYLVVVRGKNAKCVARSAVNGLSGSKKILVEGYFFSWLFLVKSVSRTKTKMWQAGIPVAFPLGKGSKSIVWMRI